MCLLFFESIIQSYICQYKFEFFSSSSSSAHKSTSWGLDWKSPSYSPSTISTLIGSDPASIVAVAQ